MKPSLKPRLLQALLRTTSLLTILLFVSIPLSAYASPRGDRVPLRERLQRIRERLRRQPPGNSLPTSRPENTSGLECNAVIAPPTTGYGSLGPYSVASESMPHPNWSGQSVYVFYPEGVNEPAPTVFFSHALNASNPDIYSALIENIVSQGYVLVYSPYPGQRDGQGATVGSRYNTLRSGFEAVVQSYGDLIDTTQVGFVGHSFGGGATPGIAYNGLLEKGWGSNGAFIFIMAPWYSTEISLAQLRQIPESTKVVVQVYEEDNINDHRIAIDLFRELNVSEKQYILLESDRSFGECSLIANHGVPASIGREGPRVNALDYYGVFRVVDALADYTFTGNVEGQQLVFGDNSQLFMGAWPNGRSTVPGRLTQSPIPTESEESYRFSVSESEVYVDQ